MVRKSVVLVAALVVLAGCAGLGASEDDAGEAPDQRADGGGDAGARDGSGGDGGGDNQADPAVGESDSEGGGQPSAAARVDRALVKTGQVTLEVENYSAAETAVESRATELGGYVAGSEVTLHHENDATWRTGYVEVRVPSENFTAMFDSTRGAGTVLSADSSIEDVTDQLVDINARLENLRSQRDQLRSLYESANTTEELLRVQERLSAVQGDIERLEAKKRSLGDRVAFSTVRVELREPVPEPVPDEEPTPFHEQSPVAVFLASVQGFVTFGRTVFIAGVAAVPWVVGLGVPALLVVGAGSRLRGPSRLPLVGRRTRLGRGTDERDRTDESSGETPRSDDAEHSTDTPSDEDSGGR
ncbi:DUF4349 domain-containing protein [Halosimplex salinum]|uniref:DUF4349 domain-containing protein n=1 Tax=Halosimplex salinum TaxID=1710538 RepID=UPI000F48BF6D|nr:DUF4349 domain-containing protein [Halosimplex salinum]